MYLNGNNQVDDAGRENINVSTDTKMNPWIGLCCHLCGFEFFSLAEIFKVEDDYSCFDCWLEKQKHG